MTTTMRLISVTPNRGSQRPSLKVKKAGALHPSKLRQVTTHLPRGAVNRKHQLHDHRLAKPTVDGVPKPAARLAPLTLSSGAVGLRDFPLFQSSCLWNSPDAPKLRIGLGQIEDCPERAEEQHSCLRGS